MYVLKASKQSSNFHQDGDHDVTGNQHYTPGGRGDNIKVLVCFKYDYEGHLTEACKFNKKENSADVNIKEEINKKYEERIEAKKARYADKSNGNKIIEGTQNFIGGAIVKSDTSSDMMDKHISKPL